MKVVNVQLKKVKMKQFLPQSKEVIFSVLFDDGVMRELDKSLVISRPSELSLSIIKEIRQFEKIKHADREVDEDDVLGGYLNVKIVNEDKAMSGLSVALSKIQSRISELRKHSGTSDYLHKVREISKLEFKI